jgi:hypothetical protein
LRRPIGIAALLCLAFATFVTGVVAAADREALYSKAEDLIRYTDDVKGLSALIAQGVDVKKPSKNSQGRTLLVSAATEGKIAMMDVLLKAGADPDTRDESGMTALRQVAWTGKNAVSATRRLIAAKADVNLVADDDWTPLIQVMCADTAWRCLSPSSCCRRAPTPASSTTKATARCCWPPHAICRC